MPLPQRIPPHCSDNTISACAMGGTSPIFTNSTVTSEKANVYVGSSPVFTTLEGFEVVALAKYLHRWQLDVAGAHIVVDEENEVGARVAAEIRGRALPPPTIATS